MIAILNQFTTPELIAIALVFIVGNTFLLWWASSRLTTDPRDDLDATSADQDAEILGEEPARSTVASPRARRLQPAGASRAGEGSSEAMEAVGPGGAKTFGGLAGGATRPGDPRDLKLYPEPDMALPLAAAATASLAAGKASLGKDIPPAAGAAAAAKPPQKESAAPPAKSAGATAAPADGGAKSPELGESKPVSLPAFASVVNAGAESKGGVTSPGSAIGKATEPTAKSEAPAGGQPATPPLGKPDLAAGKPGADLIAAKADQPADMKKSTPAQKPAAASEAAAGLIVIPPVAPGIVEPAIGAPKGPLPAAAKASGEKKEAAAPEAAAASKSPSTISATPTSSPTGTPPAPAAATAAGVPEVPPKAFWRPRIFLPTKLPDAKPTEDSKGKAPAEVVPAVAPATLSETGKSAVIPPVTMPPAKASPAAESKASPAPVSAPAAESKASPPPAAVTSPLPPPATEAKAAPAPASSPATAIPTKPAAAPETKAPEAPVAVAAPGPAPASPGTPASPVPAAALAAKASGTPAAVPPPAATSPAGSTATPSTSATPNSSKVDSPASAKPVASPAVATPAAPASASKPAEPVPAAARPPVAAVIPPLPASPPVPASPARETSPPGAITRADAPPAVPVAPVPPVPTKPSQPVMSNVPSTSVSAATKAAAQLTLGFEITSLQLTPFFKLGSVQLRPLSDVVSLHLVASQQADGPMAAGISFQIEKVELNEQSQVRSILLKPLGTAQPATIPQPKLQVDAIQLGQGEGSPIQITPSQQTSTAVQFLATFTIASMDFTPAFEIGSLRLEPTSNSVMLRLAPSQRTGSMELPPTFEMSNVQLGPEAQITALTLTPSAVPVAAEPAAK